MAQFSDRKFADVFLTKCNSKHYFLTGKLLVQFNSKIPLQALKRKGLSRAFEALKAFFFFCTAAKSVVLNNV